MVKPEKKEPEEETWAGASPIQVPWSRLLFLCRSHIFFQRLKHINQLGVLSELPGGAAFSYSRWDHCVGVGNLAAIIARRTGYGDTMLGAAFEMAACFHDVGHHVFSHSFDNYLDHLHLPPHIFPRHEKRSQDIVTLVMLDVLETIECTLIVPMTHPSYLEQKTCLDQIVISFLKLVHDFITPSHESRHDLTNPFRNLLNASDCHTLDIDRLEYLMRDRRMLRHEDPADVPRDPNVYLDSLHFDQLTRSYIWGGECCVQLMKVRQLLHKRVYDYSRRFDSVLYPFFRNLRLEASCNMWDTEAKWLFLSTLDSSRRLQIKSWFRDMNTLDFPRVQFLKDHDLAKKIVDH